MWLGLPAAVIACALLSTLVNSGVYAPFQRRGASPITLVIVSLGMTLIIEFGVQAVAGGVAVSYTMGQGPTFQAGGLSLTGLQLGIIATSVVVMAGVHVLLRYTKLGKAMRATAANRTLARNCGIRTGRVITATWALTGALCGLAGVVFAMDAGSFDATSTDLFLVLILAAVFLGGPGPGVRRDARRGRHRHRHRGQRRVHPGRLQVRHRVRGAAGHARRAPHRAAGCADMTAGRDRG